MTLPVFCDWLKMSDKGFTYQPLKWKSRIMRVDGHRIEWDRKAWVDVRDSSSRSQIKARFLDTGTLDDDGRQHGQFCIDGNLGRFGAENNLFGLPVKACSARVVPFLGEATDTFFACNQTVELRRVDLTANFVFDDAASASAYIAWAGQNKLGQAHSRPYASGCAWVTENWSAKVYDKIADLRRHKSNDLADELLSREGYVLRLETTLRTDELKHLGVNTLDKWSTDMENVIFSNRFRPLLPGSSLPSLDDLTKTLPVRLANAVDGWRNGRDFQAAMRDGRISRRTYYRLRADLLPHGIDIAQPCQVHTLAIRPRLIDMRPLARPDWLKAA